MDYLKEYLSGEAVQTAIERCRDSHAVQGVILELDPWWLKAWRWREQSDPINPAKAPGSDYPFGWWPGGPFSVSLPEDHPGPIRELEPGDLKWKPNWWKELPRPGNINDPNSPVSLRVCLYPRFGAPTQTTLPNLAELNVNYVFEIRPVPQLAAAPTATLNPLVGGASIGTGPAAYGTLGGLLQDNSGNRYGVTCAHVATGKAKVIHPSPQDGGTQQIGYVSDFDLPKGFPPGMPITAANQAAHANNVDVALIEIDPAVASKLAVDTIGPIVGIFPNGSIQQWHPAIFAGRTSNIRSVEFFAPVAYYNVPDATGTGTICFNDIRLIRWPPGGGTGGPPPIQAGDSGAWLCVSGVNGYEWAAMAVAWDPQIGFAIPASAIETWWQSIKLNLRPVYLRPR